jgi:FMN reductase (NADPH)
MSQKGAIGFISSLVKLLSGKPQIPPSLEDNTLLQTILNRRSVRKFSGRPIPDDVFTAILEAGRLAPSTVNLQTWSFAVFSAESWKGKFGRTIPFKGQRAVIVLGDTHRDRVVLDAFPQSPLVEYTTAVMNAALAAMNMNIAAEALGVSSVMLSETGRSGLLDAGYLKEALALPDRVVPIMTIIFGYASGRYPPMPPKLPLDQIIFEDEYHKASQEVMQDWLAQMQAGFKASRIGSSFEAQLQVYVSKIEQAESDLHDIIFVEDHENGV